MKVCDVPKCGLEGKLSLSFGTFRPQSEGNLDLCEFHHGYFKGIVSETLRDPRGLPQDPTRKVMKP